MTDGGQDGSWREDFVTYRTVLTRGKTGGRTGGCYRRVGDLGMSEGGHSRLRYENGIALGAIYTQGKTCLGAGRGYGIYGHLSVTESVNVSIHVGRSAVADVGGIAVFGTGGRSG